MSRTLPTLRIGSHAAMSIDIEHVRVFAEDADAFRGVIAARAALVEKQITRFVAPDQRAKGLCEETLNLALDAMLEMRNAGADRDKVIRHLELAAAMAIATIITLRQD
ncbi:hypothetical protein ACLBKT_01225 [Erythrobacter sp. W302b]|uniref:hypothetical protein n=1 Tax=Erythrobacter sp. W302b TaxID=3389874 RepID=UPI00396AF9DE